jgi:hypothetical protein
MWKQNLIRFSLRLRMVVFIQQREVEVFLSGGFGQAECGLADEFNVGID